METRRPSTSRFQNCQPLQAGAPWSWAPTWWIEPVRHGEFRMDYPFLDLPNVIGSPHNSAQAGAPGTAIRNAATNCRRALRGETPLFLIGDDERMS